MKSYFNTDTDGLFAADFVAQTYTEWQQTEARRKPYRMLQRLRKCKPTRRLHPPALKTRKHQNAVNG